MRAAVTGGAGFIGSHLVDHLLENGHEVVVLDDLSTGSLTNLAGVADHPRLAVITGSILDGNATESAIAGCDTVFHLAAAVGVRTIVDSPIASLRTNLHGTEVVIDAAVRHGCRLLFTSTSEVYGKNTADRLPEDADRILGSPLKSRWSYAAAKGLDELLVYETWRTRGLPAVIVRPFNIVGPRQTGRYGMVVPRFAAQAVAGQPITVYGDGTQRRCFGAVADIVPALVALVEHAPAHGQVFNLGGTEEVTMNDLARRIRERAGSSSDIVHVPYDDAYGPGYEDMQRRVPDTTKAHRAIGFTPTRGLDDIIASVVATAGAAPVPT